MIIGPDVGGAEMMLKRLVESHLGNPAYRHVVVSLTDKGTLGTQLQSKGVEVYSLGMRSAFGIPLVLWRTYTTAFFSWGRAATSLLS